MLAPKEIILKDDTGKDQCSKSQLDFIMALCQQHGGNEKLFRFLSKGNMAAFQKRLSMIDASRLISCLNQNQNWRFKEV